MIEAFLTYRPTSLFMLCGAVGILRRKERLDSYAGDLLWLTAKGLYKRFGAASYSEYAAFVNSGKTVKQVKNEVQQAAVNMINMFLPKKC